MIKSKIAPIECRDILLHGWDAQAQAWHGPIPLAADPRGTRLALARLRTARGPFHGKLRCSVPGLPCIEFCTAVYDLSDAGLAIVHLDGSNDGPVGIVAVVPRHRRGLLRSEFAFELMTLISFLGAPANRGCELEIHDYIDQALRMEPSATQVFTVETAELNPDTGIVLSAHFERLAAAMLEWMAAREAEDDAVLEGEEGETCTKMPVDCPPITLSAGCAVV